MKTPEQIKKELCEPFPETDIEWRVARSGMSRNSNKPYAFVLAYITARAVWDRLDDVVGPNGWQTTTRKEGEGFVANLRLFMDGVWIEREDGSAETAFEAFKGGISGAYKRVAAQFGIGRYLYNLTENFADIREGGRFRAKMKDKSNNDFWYDWNPPPLPKWALPSDHEANTGVF